VRGAADPRESVAAPKTSSSHKYASVAPVPQLTRPGDEYWGEMARKAKHEEDGNLIRAKWLDHDEFELHDTKMYG
jgi:hypothetical protein